jgi:hypothetical protein
LSVSPRLIRDTCLCESWTHQRYLSVWVLDSSEIHVCVSPGLIRDTCQESRTHTEKYLWGVQDSHREVSLRSPGLTQTSISEESRSPGLIRDTCLCESWTHQRYLSVWVLDSSLVFVTHNFWLMSPGLTQTRISDESRTHTDKYLWWVQDSHRQVSLMSPGLTDKYLWWVQTHTEKYLWRFLSVWVWTHHLCL